MVEKNGYEKEGHLNQERVRRAENEHGNCRWEEKLVRSNCNSNLRSKE